MPSLVQDDRGTRRQGDTNHPLPKAEIRGGVFGVRETRNQNGRLFGEPAVLVVGRVPSCAK